VEAVTVAVTTTWSGRALATWNRQVATVRSFLAFCRRRRWLVDDIAADLERRPEPVDRTKAIPLPQLERLWRCKDVAVREKALWRAAYETAAWAQAAPSRLIAQDEHQPHLGAFEHRIEQAATQEWDGEDVGHPRVRLHVERRLPRVWGVP
jgi:hypothetical protein